MISTVAGGVRLDVRVIPRAPRSSIEGIRNNRLLIRVTAPPVDSAANEAAVALLSRTLKVPRHAVHLIAGERSRDKSIVLRGASADEIRRRLEIILPDRA